MRVKTDCQSFRETKRKAAKETLTMARKKSLGNCCWSWRYIMVCYQIKRERILGWKKIAGDYHGANAFLLTCAYSNQSWRHTDTSLRSSPGRTEVNLDWPRWPWLLRLSLLTLCGFVHAPLCKVPWKTCSPCWWLGLIHKLQPELTFGSPLAATKPCPFQASVCCSPIIWHPIPVLSLHPQF